MIRRSFATVFFINYDKNVKSDPSMTHDFLFRKESAFFIGQFTLCPVRDIISIEKLLTATTNPIGTIYKKVKSGAKIVICPVDIKQK